MGKDVEEIGLDLFHGTIQVFAEGLTRNHKETPVGMFGVLVEILTGTTSCI
jgi:hypothetical protein